MRVSEKSALALCQLPSILWNQVILGKLILGLTIRSPFHRSDSGNMSFNTHSIDAIPIEA
uniref:Uncharacterized protein n=1 Tax=Utricularia reniformis TaxID=192314 RepID=A0A1Y0B388_9LAMI|nr:hypothetical protein AEK19_MT1625 [Utricularia reniformis]ART31809.1 hypothetical protein AEK19_MT1625 [Utricularia reniformis]